MNYGIIPDLAAMAVLIAILLLLRRRHPKKSVDLWLLGLGIIFVEDLARLFYYSNSQVFLHRLSHSVALDAYVLAGLIFTVGAGHESFSRRNRFLYIGINTIPLLAIPTLYGIDSTNRDLYLACCGAGLFIGVISAVAFRRRWPLILANLAGWPFVAWLATFGPLRQPVYWELGCLYIIAAFAFQKSLPVKSSGRLAIFTGFILWSVCFLVHPWVLHYHAWNDINEQIWSMQKFLISIGMLIVMLEDQITSNEWLALHDQLTGLPNRRLFEDRLAQALGRSQRLQTSVVLIMIDLDGFKAINDSYGHAGGDELLRGITANLTNTVRSSDTLARLGGDEFVVLAGDMPANVVETTSVQRLVEAIQTAIRKPILVAGNPISISGSLGVAIAPDDAKNPEQLLQTADRRMYKLKKQASKMRAAYTQQTPIA